MVSILPREPSLGELLGSGFGQGLQSGIQQQMAQNRQGEQGQALAQILGFSPEQSEAMQKVSPDVQKAFVEDFFKQKAFQEKQAFTEKPETKKYIESAQENADVAMEQTPNIQRLRELSKDSSRFLPFSAANKEFDQLSFTLFQQFKSYFKGQLRVTEFQEAMKRLVSVYGLQGAIDKGLDFFERAASHATKKQQLIDQYRSQGVPVNQIPSLVNKQLESDMKVLVDELKQAAGVKKDSGMEELPSAKENEGRVVRDTKTGKKYKSENGKWQVIQ